MPRIKSAISIIEARLLPTLGDMRLPFGKLRERTLVRAGINAFHYRRPRDYCRYGFCISPTRRGAPRTQVALCVFCGYRRFLFPCRFCKSGRIGTNRRSLFGGTRRSIAKFDMIRRSAIRGYLSSVAALAVSNDIAMSPAVPVTTISAMLLPCASVSQMWPLRPEFRAAVRRANSKTPWN